MTEAPDIREILLADDCLCPDCRRQIRRVGRSFRVAGIWIHVLLEKDPFLEDLCTRFIGMRDVVLAPVFLQGERRLVRQLWRKRLTAVAASPSLLSVRGSDPLEEVLEAAGLRAGRIWQQAERKGPQPAACRSVPGRSLAVCLEPENVGDPAAFLKQSGCRELLVLMAGPEWLKDHKKDRRPHPLFR